MAGTVQTRRDDDVAVISIDRPERHNAMDKTTYDELLEAVTNAIEEADVRVLVLRGEGRSFSSGVDTAGMGQRRAGETHWSHGRHTQELNLRLAASPKPVVAALKGYVLGKGLETALAADVRVVAHGARLGFPEATFGLVTDNGGAPRAVSLIGPARTKYLLMSGALIDAPTAVQWGLAEWAVDAEDLDDRALQVAHELAQGAPLAVAVAKELVDQVHRGAITNGTRTEMLAQIALMATEDHREAKAARAEKRPPSFQGR
jgi:enoyl-CoA hydratase/carnithine racemase